MTLMGNKTAIEWTDATWNPVTGCSNVSPGCANCYAERVSHRFGSTTRLAQQLDVIILLRLAGVRARVIRPRDWLSGYVERELTGAG